MKPKFKLTMRLTEIMLLIFELQIGLAGVAMVLSAITGDGSLLYLPANVLAGLIPAILTVGFAAWLVYRFRCISRARHRAWALLGATCLGFVAMGFGAAIGKLNGFFFSDIYAKALVTAVGDQQLKHAGLTSLLAFLGIGFVFAVTFILRAARGPWEHETNSDELHARLNRLGAKLIPDWSEQLVGQIDRHLATQDVTAAIEVYRQATGANLDVATCVIGDWPEERLRIELDLLTNSVHAPANAAPFEVARS
jgi:hypothetical protein